MRACESVFFMNAVVWLTLQIVWLHVKREHLTFAPFSLSPRTYARVFRGESKPLAILPSLSRLRSACEET